MADEPTITTEDGPPEKVDVSALHAPVIREKLEPRDGFEPVPIWLVAVFGIVVFWGGYYVAMYNGGWDPDFVDGDPMPVAGALTVAPGPVDPLVLGKKLYAGNCVSCHQANGQGVPGQYPPLAGSEWVTDPARSNALIRLILHGLSGPVEVNGQTYNGNMPAFGAKFKDEQVAAVLSYIRTDWSNAAPAVKPEDVAAVRASVKRTEPWTAGELTK
jgi:mono/diheme cytochrome c family protein